MDVGFNYVLTTAKGWNGPIKHFSLAIELPEYSCVYKPILDLIPYGQYKEDPYDYYFFRRGGFFFTATDFVPETDLWIVITTLPFHLFVYYPLEGNKNITMAELLFFGLNDKDLVALTKEELRILRNAIYAWHGYKFVDPELDAYFSRQPWYFPEEDNQNIQLREVEQKNLELILEYERKQSEAAL